MQLGYSENQKEYLTLKKICVAPIWCIKTKFNYNYIYLMEYIVQFGIKTDNWTVWFRFNQSHLKIIGDYFLLKLYITKTKHIPFGL